jgi:hypothetical protein
MYARPLRHVSASRSWARARSDYALRTAERDAARARCEDLEREHERLLDLLRLARALIRTAKGNVASEITALERERDIAQAQAVQRDPDQPLQ